MNTVRAVHHARRCCLSHSAESAVAIPEHTANKSDETGSANIIVWKDVGRALSQAVGEFEPARGGGSASA
jgi:formiminotetrahydrofolate cyclodeaminase